MSKFCHVISESEEEESKLQAPFTFEQLENLINLLSKEILETESDFSREADYVAKRDVQTSNNNEELTKLCEVVQRYALDLSIVETEIAAHEKTLSQIGKLAGRLEERQGVVYSTQEFPTDYAAIFALIQAFDLQMVQTKEEMETVSELIAVEEALSMSEATQEVITSILSIHLDLLLHIERSLAHVDETCEDVERQLRALRRKQSQLFGD